MTFKDLESHQVFLPESEWGKLDLHTSVNKTALTATLVTGGVSCVLMATGGGSWTTWAGAALYVVFLYAFTVVSNRGVDRQNETIAKLQRGGRRP